MSSLTCKQANLLVANDHHPRIFSYQTYSGNTEYRIAYWVPVLGVKQSGFFNTYEQAEAYLQREDWEVRAEPMLVGELDILLNRQKELTIELETITNQIVSIQQHFHNRG